MKEIFNNWLDRIKDKSGLPSEEIEALNFGLIETESGYSVYLIGAKKYHEKDDDWATEEDYSPEPRYLNLPEIYISLEWSDVLEKFSSDLSEFLKDGHPILDTTVITTGFDDGDLVRIK